jgi:hypothetical protein
MRCRNMVSAAVFLFPGFAGSVKFMSLPLNNLLMPNLLTIIPKGDIMLITAKNVEISKKREV